VLELLVGLALFGLVALASSAVFSTTFRGWTSGRDLADEQQNARMVLEWMTRRVRMAGYNTPFGTTEFFTQADVASLAFLADINGDGSAELHRFCLDTTQGVVREEVGTVSTTCTASTGTPITSRGIRPPRIVGLQFAYFDGREIDGLGNLLGPLPLTAPADRSLVVRVRITLTTDSNRSGAIEASDLSIAMDAVVRNYGD
jgi:hypothetical protein